MDLTEANATMVRDVYLSTEKRANRKMADSPEYDTQQLVCHFFEDWLRNTNFSVRRERGGKFDLVIYENGTEHTFYEIKTYFKATEKIAESALLADIKKLSKKIAISGAAGKAYLLIAGRKEKLHSSTLPDFVRAHVASNRSFYSWPNECGVRVRPSKKDVSNGQTFVMTWQVIPNR